MRGSAVRLWAFSSPAMTVYAMQPGRGFAPAAAILGEGFDGLLVRDGWSVYRQFGKAVHQTCLAHLLRRCREMVQTAGGRGAQFPRAIQTLLQSGLRLRDRLDQEQSSPHGLAVARGKPHAQRSADALLECQPISSWCLIFNITDTERILYLVSDCNK